LTWSNGRSAALAQYLSYGYLGSVDNTALNEANAMTTTIDGDIADLKTGPCT
jgi:hypothetical protein